LFSDPAIAAITERDDFAFSDLQCAPQPVTLYLGAEIPWTSCICIRSIGC
jgi:hypothetical protein